jgi:predicted dehydrogenase
MKYRAAVIGCGRIGAGYDDDPLRGYVATHVGAYSERDDIELVALCDTDRYRVHRYAEQYHVPGRFTDVVEMLAQSKPDIVSVCTPASTHRQLVEQCAEMGARAIFCEKPIATTLEDADAMVQYCQQRNVLFCIDHQRRFERFHRSCREVIFSGGIGRMQRAVCVYGGGIRNTGSHLVDFLRFCLGDVAWVWARAAVMDPVGADDPSVDGILGFQGNVVAHLIPIEISAHAIFEFSFIGTEGSIVLNSVGNNVTARYAVAEASRFSGEIRELQPAPFPVSPLASHECMRDAVTHLVHCLDGNSQPWSTGNDGREALRVVLALLESQRTQTIVTL